MSRRRYAFYVEHPAVQRAIANRLKHEPGETAEDRQMVEAAIVELERLLSSRVRRRRLPSERVAGRAQRSLFRRAKP